jgi:hypothetical protein
MSPDERLELDEVFCAERDERIAVKRRASETIEALPPAEQLAALTKLQDHLIDLTPDDQIAELFT